MRLTDCFVELIAYVAYLNKNAASQQPHFEQVKADINRLLSQSQNHMARGSISQEDYDLARFAIVAWIDEIIMNSNWPEKDKWRRELLQRTYYETADAGEIFFERLNSIGPHQRDVREVYYLCLAMGFQGRYSHPGDEYLLEQLKLSNLKLLSGISLGIPSLEKSELFPEAYPGESQADPNRKPLRRLSVLTLVGLATPVILFAGLFVIYTFILNHFGDNILSRVP